MVSKKKVVWDELAKKILKQSYYYIQKDSALQAEKVKRDILETVKKLADHPERHPPDKYRKDKDDRFSAFEIYNYRISTL